MVHITAEGAPAELGNRERAQMHIAFPWPTVATPPARRYYGRTDGLFEATPAEPTPALHTLTS